MSEYDEFLNDILIMDYYYLKDMNDPGNAESEEYINQILKEDYYESL